MVELVSAVAVILAKDMAEVVSAVAVVVAEVVSVVVVTEVASTVAEGKSLPVTVNLTHAVTTTKSKASPPVQIINYTRNTKLRSYSYSCYYLLFVVII